MRDSVSAKSSKSFNTFWVLASLLWIPLCFLNFDAHHDGIILTTVNQLKQSLVSGGSWPFNQYGSFWAFPYVLISFVIPQGFLLLGIRLLTIVFYIGATFFLFKSAVMAFGLKTAQISVFIYLAFQPFLGPWNTSLLPWPSSLVTLLIAMILYLLMVAVGTEGNVRIYLMAIGFLSALILGSRLQIGLLLLMALSLVFKYLQIGKFRYLIYGVLLWLVPWSVFLQFKSWLIPSLYDSVILGAQFLGSDHLHYPLPFLSVFAGISVFVWLELTLAGKLNKYFHLLFLFAAIVSTVFLSRRVLGESFNFANYLSVTQRKLLAALFFASLLIIAMQICKLIRHLRNTQSDKEITRTTLFLLISICSSAQAWPFFDQMHIWWSFAPLVVFFADRVSNINLTNLYQMYAGVLIFSLGLMSYLVIAQFSGAKTELKAIDQNLIFVNLSDDRNEKKVQDFIREKIPAGSSILNLCPNAYPFFVSKTYESESRFFVYWSNFESAPISFKDFDSGRVSYVLTCNTYLYQGEELSKYNSRKQLILDSIPGIFLVGDLNEGAFNWQVFKKK